jgi:squalene-associated FAD-dependent desaturase
VSAGRVVVAGGGLAGITAALDLAAAGAEVTLVEVRPRLGGAAYSVPREGLEMDNGQHVFLRCCEAYRSLLARLGSSSLVSVQPRLRIPVLRPGHEPYVIRRGSLPPPAHLAGALVRYRHLPLRERLSAARAALALMRLSKARAHELEGLTLGQWLARHGQSARAIASLWDLIALPTLNLPAREASLQLGAFVFQTGLLESAGGGDIGFHEHTLAGTIGRPAERALADAGVRVLLGWRARGLVRAGGGFELLGGSGQDGGSGHEGGSGHDGREGEGLSADAVVVALPHERAASLLEPLFGDRTGAWRRLGSSPIVNLHLLYDRLVLEEPFAAGVQTPVQYIFDRTRAGGAPAGHQYLAVSLSGASREMKMSVDELRELYVPALRALLPRTREARLELFLVTREHAATFRASPGADSLRPPPGLAMGGLAVAGTWTATGWPATLESAVISGRAAARALIADLEGRPAEPATALAGA